MNTLLLVITVVSLVVAVVSATVAVRVTRADRRRREGRVAALAAAAGVPDAAGAPVDLASAPRPMAVDAALSPAFDPEVVVAAGSLPRRRHLGIGQRDPPVLAHGRRDLRDGARGHGRGGVVLERRPPPATPRSPTASHRSNW